MIGLAFSGGKDSWACLHLYMDSIKDITVIWVNTGKNYPIALEFIEKARSMCPNFVEIKSDQEGQTLKNGLPSDVVPINWTVIGQEMTGKKSFFIQSYLGCCYENISKPLNDKIKELGINVLISGQRADEVHKSKLIDGQVLDGVKHVHPLSDWTREQVMDYLNTKMDIPEHFNLNHSSLDCYDCTAYLSETKDRLQWAKNKYPNLHEENLKKLNMLKVACDKEMSHLFDSEV